MRRAGPRYHNGVKNPLDGSRNWEENIRSVVIETCQDDIDPLGYKAVFYLSYEAAQKTKKECFEIGASFLVQRKHNLSRAGYKIPMTEQAIEKIEAIMGQALPMFLGNVTTNTVYA